MNDLQLFSFHINNESIDDIELDVFKLPLEVKRAILDLIGDSGKNRNVAASSIFKIAISLFDNVIYANNSLGNIEKDDGIWFYSIDKFDLDILKVKVNDWLREEYKTRKDINFEKIFEENWEFNGKILLKDILTRENGSKFSIIENYYMYVLSKKMFKFESLNRNLKFYRTIEDNKTILMTMPIKLERKIYTPFSYFIESRLRKPIDVEDYTLNFYLKIRVWKDYTLMKEDRPESYLTFKEYTSVYIYRENEYYDGKDIIFNRIKLKGDKKSIYTINDTSERIYSKLLDIDIANILKSPKDYMDEYNECIALINNKDKGKLRTQYGAGLPERNEMLYNLVDFLPNLNLRRPIKLISKTSKSKIIKASKEIIEEYELEDKIDKVPIINKGRYILNRDIKKVVFNIYTNEEELFNKIRALIHMYLRLDKHLLVEGVSKDGYEVDIKHYNNDFTRPLATDGNKDERVNEIKAIIPKNDNSMINLAIIDIEPYHNNSMKNYDPKQLIRSTFKENRILTQFINYNNDRAIEVIMNSIKDLISAAGFIDDYLYKNTGIENNDILVGINKVSGGENENILAMTKIEKGRTYINIYGIDKWMMLDECIYTINRSFINKVKIQRIFPATKTSVNDWIVSNLSNILKGRNKVYTFIDANIRMNLWTFIQNKRFNKANLENLSLINKENLRLIRVNYTDEVPEYFIYDEKKNNINKSSGIFKSDKNTYYLVGKRQETDQANNSWTKCDKPNKPLRKPSIYEVNIIGCEDEEELDSIAQITQLLRMMNISYDSHASLPLPMYITKRLSEYILAEKLK